jgi:hypothetical protein
MNAFLAAALLSVSLSARADDGGALFDGAARGPRVPVSRLGVDYDAPADGANPMLTDPGFRPRTAPDRGAPEAKAASDPPAPPDPVHWDAEIFGGGNINQVNPISFDQLGSGAQGGGGSAGVVTHGGRTPYYAARVSRWQGGGAWELQGINTNVFLNYVPRNGSDDDILRGYDHFLVNRAARLWGLIWRLGAGVVITHPEPTQSQINARSSGSYYFSGVGGQASVAKRIPISDHVFTTVEGNVTSDYPQASIPGNTVTPPTHAFNGVLGLGLNF